MSLATRAFRSALVRYVRAQPRKEDWEGAERRVYIMLMTAYGMGGTIRSTLNLATYLASQGYEVIFVSVGRARDEPFFEMPPGVRIVTLDDKREHKLPGRMQPFHRWMRERDSVLMHPDDIGFRGFSAWVDWRLAKTLRRKTGFFITTRPGLNLLSALLSPPGLVLVGQEHMHLRDHSEDIQDAMTRQYRKLAVLSVLTEGDRRRYRRHLDRKVPVVHIPNAVRDMGGVRADLSAKVVVAAGRLARQKGYDRLIKAWEQVASEHPEWRLRIYGNGPKQRMLERMIAERGLEGVVTLEGPTTDLGTAMSEASIFALSSRWEGLPLVLMEAMSVGMACVSFDCPTGPGELIDDHVNGLLIRPKTIANMAAGLSEMMSDEDLRRRCAAAALETAREYSMDWIGPHWEETLESAWKRREAKRSRAAAPRAAAPSAHR